MRTPPSLIHRSDHLVLLSLILARSCSTEPRLHHLVGLNSVLLFQCLDCAAAAIESSAFQNAGD